MEKSRPINENFPHILHGGDYNPDQWIDYQDIWDEDMRMIKLAGCNAMSIGIFSWSTLEPEEGKYDFSFLDEIMDKLNEIGAKAILATPSGARPRWLAEKYPEVLRVNENRVQSLYGERHNHCYTSPLYREKTAKINRLLANRYKNHPALLLWHISNEFSGECHCDMCQKAFRNWLKAKYNNDLDKLNAQWWTGFWSHTYTSWEQIESPSSIGEQNLHGLVLDWKRFVTYQTGEFIKNETAPLREITKNIPITTNFMGTYDGLDYDKLKEVVDVISWDSYPEWHQASGCVELARNTALIHDHNRSLKGKPFMLMESTPSLTNWKPVNKLKRPGMHILSSVQAISHGSDTVQYFQWRKSRGGSEKFHGAVVDHCGHENTRVFKEVAKLGEMLKKMDDIVGTYTPVETAIIFDWENRWALEQAQCLERTNKYYLETVNEHYNTFWDNGVNVDMIDSICDFSKYKLIIAPMLYMIKPGVEEKIEKFVKDGGVFVATYFSGVVNENDLCFLGGTPCGKLKDVFGIWAEEIDTLYPEEVNKVNLGDKEYNAKHFCELIHANEAEILGRYTSDFYEGMPSLTVNNYGKGKAYYIAFKDDGAFSKDFYETLIKENNIKKSLDTKLPYGVTAHTRCDAENEYLFIENYNDTEKDVTLNAKQYTDMMTGETAKDCIKMSGYDVKILKSKI